jgi:RND superfamily putative drug exporter
MFRFLAQLVCRRPWLCIGVWVGVAVLSWAFAPSAEQLQRSESASLLPADSPLNVGMRLYADAFPDQTARSRIVLVFERPSGLTAADRAFLADLARRLEQAGLNSPEPWRVWSGELSPALRLRLYSEDGQSAMIALGLDVNFLTERAAAVVDRVEHLAHADLPEGLALEVTGTAAIGREHNIRSADALQRTTRMTIAAVLIILALVYRSPLGALVPLISIGLSVFVAFRVLDFLAQAGWSISGAERMFTVVVLFGAGTNYALFWISRYRESLSYGRSRAKAVMEAMDGVRGAGHAGQRRHDHLWADDVDGCRHGHHPQLGKSVGAGALGRAARLDDTDPGHGRRNGRCVFLAAKHDRPLFRRAALHLAATRRKSREATTRRVRLRVAAGQPARVVVLPRAAALRQLWRNTGRHHSGTRPRHGPHSFLRS